MNTLMLLLIPVTSSNMLLNWHHTILGPCASIVLAQDSYLQTNSASRSELMSSNPEAHVPTL